MGNQPTQEASVKSEVKPATTEEKPKLKPCCVCLETKAVRDECIIQNGEEHCQDLIEAHKKCMRDLGFNI